jgi:hypothetical protein
MHSFEVSKWQYIRQLPKSKLKMHDYTDINYIDTCIYKNLNFISNSYRGMYNLKDCNEIKKLKLYTSIYGFFVSCTEMLIT